MSEPQRVDASSEPVAADEKPQLYRSLLNEYAQKLWKELPIYQTRNEGSDHQPKFRSTVWADGVSYTSPNTFKQRKMAEMDVSKIAVFATRHKLKNEALRHVHEDKSFCKSILMEYAARKYIQKPTYETKQLDTPVPVFRSTLVFNGVSCTGDDCKSKKEAEQSAAQAIILKYLDSESESVFSEIINCKFRNYAQMKDIPGAHNGTNAVVQTGVDHGANAVVQTGVDHGANEVVQTGVDHGAHAVGQTGVDHGANTVVQTGVDHGANAVAQTGVDHGGNAVVQTGVDHGANAVVQTGVDNCITSNEGKVEEETKMLNTTALPEPCSLVQGTTIPPRNIPEESTKKLTLVPTFLAPALHGGVPAPTPTPTPTPTPSLEQLARIIANHLSSNVAQFGNLEASPAMVAPPPLPLSSPTEAQPMVVSQGSGKKRNRRNKKNAQTKRRAEDQSSMPAIVLNQVPKFSAQ